MSEELWTRIDEYIGGIVLEPDPVLDACLADSAAAGLPAIAVSPPQGKFLQLLARLANARSILEIGTLGGYSTIWMARALPAGGKLITLELNEKHAAVARKNFNRAGLSKVIDLRLGGALETLPMLAKDGQVFDLVFIDADKINITEYFDWSVKMTRPGGLIVVDNVVRKGAVADSATSDDIVKGVQRFNAALKSDKRVSATTLQLVGVKGYDGMTLAIKL